MKTTLRKTTSSKWELREKVRCCTLLSVCSFPPSPTFPTRLNTPFDSSFSSFKPRIEKKGGERPRNHGHVITEKEEKGVYIALCSTCLSFFLSPRPFSLLIDQQEQKGRAQRLEFTDVERRGNGKVEMEMEQCQIKGPPFFLNKNFSKLKY